VFVTTIHVFPTTEVQWLLSIFPKGPATFIFNGMTMIASKTLEYYGVGDSDLIVMLPASRKVHDVAKLVSVTRDIDEAKDRMRFLLNGERLEETARLHDVQIMRMEARPKMYRKLLCDVDATNYDSGPQRFSRTVISARPPAHPSEDPLPLW
jgi:hypothetical protein